MTADVKADPNGHDPRRMLTALQVVVYDWNLSSDTISWSPNAAEVFGFDPAHRWPTGQAFEGAAEAYEGPTRGDVVARADAGDDAGSGAGFAALYRLKLGPDDARVVDDSGRWFAGEDGLPARVHGVMRVRQDALPAEAAPAVRNGFLEQVALDIAENRAAGRALTLVVVSIANLGALNDDLGFDAADHILDTVTVRLAGSMRRRDRLVRYAGNRFALALRGCSAAEAEIAAARLVRLVATDPVGTAKGPIPVQVAIGGAAAPDHAVDASLLLRRAESALGLAKRRSAPFVMYDAKLFRQETRGRRDPMMEGLDVLNGRRIVLALQPIVSAKTGEVGFSEALLRVRAEDGTIRPADDVIPALERAGLVHLADIRMLELAAEHLANHPRERVSINVSPMTMERPDWLPTLSAHLGARLDVASRLIVEVTETAAIREPKAMRALLEATRSLGAAVAIDDFGAGYTSFRNLRSFPVDFVKIDGAFVQNLTRSADDRYFVRTLIDLARHLGIAVVAEWVEDAESAALLASWGAEYLQGEHCGAPRLVAGEPPAQLLVA